MCIIVIKLSGANVPSEDTFRTCFINNPDGAGFMYKDVDGTVHIHKGFMKFSDFYSDFSSFKFNKKNTLVAHFRRATSGGRNPENTHPFPITNNVSDLKSTKCRCAYGIVHNGVISRGSENMSDTMLFVKDILSSPSVISNIINPDVLKLISSYINPSRIAIMSASNVYYVGGDGWVKEENDRLIYSNSSYINTSKVCSNSISFDGRRWVECKDDDGVDTYIYYSNHKKDDDSKIVNSNTSINNNLCKWCSSKNLLNNDSICEDCMRITL